MSGEKKVNKKAHDLDRSSLDHGYYLITRCGKHCALCIDRDVGDRRLVCLNNVDDLQSKSIENQDVTRWSVWCISSVA